MIEEYYRYGVQHGKFTSYHPNGKLFGEGQYEDGKREGYFKVYDENGNQIKTLLFIHNNLMEEVENTTNESQNISSP
jgi:MORN repeat variant.